jgi:transcriptional regulator with XRE-family HTH domain
MAFGDDVNRLRREAGLTQAELAKKAGISRAYLSLVEINRRGVMPPIADAIADALGLKGDARTGLVAAAAMTQGSDELLTLLHESRQQVRYLTLLCGLGVEPTTNPAEVKKYGQEAAERLAVLRRANQQLFDQLQAARGKVKPPKMTGFDEPFPDVSPRPASPLPRRRGRPPG